MATHEKDLLELLKSLEWCGHLLIANEDPHEPREVLVYDTDICPLCENPKGDGHTPVCLLGMQIKLLTLMTGPGDKKEGH